MRWDEQDLWHLVRRQQSGTVRRQQVLALGGTDDDIARLVRRRLLTAALPGVYVDHTGPLTYDQRAWCAVHVHWPAALTGWSVVPDAPRSVVHVAIDDRRTVRRLPGIVAHRTSGLDTRTHWHRSPPRTILEHALVDLASVARVDEAFELLALAVASRRTQPERIREALATRSRVRQRGLLLALLHDIEAGACSVLERGFLHEVERRHGLPQGRRQAPYRETTSSGYRDVVYRLYRLIVELDGRTHHGTVAAWNADHDRDLDAAVADAATTVRLGYRQVFGGACVTAARLAVLLRRGGWTGEALRCPNCPAGLGA
jgi:hypothetical protein